MNSHLKIQPLRERKIQTSLGKDAFYLAEICFRLSCERGTSCSHWFAVFEGARALGRAPEDQPRTRRSTCANSGVGVAYEEAVLHLCCWTEESVRLPWPRCASPVLRTTLWTPSVSCPHLPAALILSLGLPLSTAQEIAYRSQLVPVHTAAIQGAIQQPCRVLLVFDLSSSRKPYFILNELFLFLSLNAHSREAH